MKHIGELARTVEKSKDLSLAGRKGKTERGELMRYFRTHLNAGRAKDGLPLVSMARMGFILTGIPTKDLYYLKSVCDKAKHFSKKFWYEVDPKKHTQEAKEEKPF
ncbi:MAG: hypothetical protein WBK28_02755 [Minisyncoccia bacterium]